MSFTDQDMPASPWRVEFTGPTTDSVTGDPVDAGYVVVHNFQGMTIRDAAAFKALQGLCANSGGPFQANGTGGWALVNCTEDQVADLAYSLADAMIRARKRSAT